MKKYILFIVVLVAVSCNNNAKEKEECTSKETKDVAFDMYEMSEMATLMEQMYKENELLKQRIEKGDSIGTFSQNFLKIHSAVMTDETDNDAFFQLQAKNFIAAQEQIYADSVNAKTHFNNAIDACINCHKVKCGGPIPKIKKLYID